MLSNEFLLEEMLTEGVVVGTFRLENMIIQLSDHYFDRLHKRDKHVPLDCQTAYAAFLKLVKAKKKMARLPLGQQFWVIDHEYGVSTGLRRLADLRDGTMVDYLGTVVTPMLDGSPGVPNGDLNPWIHIP